MALLIVALLIVPLSLFLRAERRRRERRLASLVADEIERRARSTEDEGLSGPDDGRVSVRRNPVTGEIVATKIANGHTYIVRLPDDPENHLDEGQGRSSS